MALDGGIVAPATLSALYLALLLWVGVDQARLVRAGHRVLHYRSLFNIFICAWMALRAVFWLLAVTGARLPQLWKDLIFWLPHTLMLGCFATLAVFISKVLTGPLWTGALRRRYLRAYAALAALNIMGTVACSVLDWQLAGGAGQGAVQGPKSGWSGALYLLLAGVFA